MNTLKIEGVIGRKEDPTIAKGEKLFSLEDLEAFLAKQGGEPFDVIINSPGGNVEEGFKIYNKLKGYEVTTTARTANSIASVIFLAGKTRKVTATSEIIIHNAWIDAEALAGEKLNFHTLKELTNLFAQNDLSILEVYTSVAGDANASKLLALMAEETNIGGAQALALGFATEMIEEDYKALTFKNRVLTYSQNQIGILNVQDGPVTTYGDVVYVNSAGEVLLLQRKEDDDFQPGKWGFPGGKVMQGETTEDGAARELEEETGIKADGLERLEERVNEDESLSVYFYTKGDELPGDLPEHQSAEFVALDAFENKPFIKFQFERFYDIAKQVLTKIDLEEMDNKEKVTAFEKMLSGVKNLFKLQLKNMATMTAEGVAIFIAGAEDGELVGKTVYLAEEGLPTETLAPAGTHELEDGSTIVVDESGAITEVMEAAPVEIPEDVEALKATFEEEKNALKAAFEEEKKALAAKVEALTNDRATATAKLEKLASDFSDLKNQVLGDPDEKTKAPALPAEDFAKLPQSEKIRLRAMAKATSN